MKTILRKNTWLSLTNHGWGNGYVLIPVGHPMHGVHYDDIPVEVHGGLTFSKPASKCIGFMGISEEDKDCWVVGFYTAHWNDTLANWPKSRVENETENLRKQLEVM